MSCARRLLLSCACACAVGILAPAGPALGASVSVTTVPRTMSQDKGNDVTVTVSTYAFRAAPGEVNIPAISLSPDGRTLTARDAGAPLDAGEGCTAVDAHEVRCVATGQQIGEVYGAPVTVALGDGDDVLAAVDARDRSVAVDAGPGDDRVEVLAGGVLGGEGRDDLRAGPTSTSVSLDGGPGDDVLTGGPGDDTLFGGPGRDLIDGGEGADSAYWPEETRPVTVDLRAPGPAGPAEELDDLRNVESAGGGTGADVLRGSEGANGLSGGGGDDVLVGRGGNDAIDTGAGADRVEAGPGKDEVLATDFVAIGAADTLDAGPGADRIYSLSGGSRLLGGGGNDRLEFTVGTAGVDGGPGDDLFEGPDGPDDAVPIACGSGRDRVHQMAQDQVLPGDCELLLVGHEDDDFAIANRVRLTRGGARIDVPLPNFCDATRRCRMTVQVRAGAKVLARATRTLGRGGRGTRLELRLDRHARTALKGRATVRLRFKERDGRFWWPGIFALVRG